MADAILKRCSKCKLELPHTEFSPDRRASDGFQPSCRACNREAKRARYASDPDGARQRNRAYYSSNKERVLATNAKSRKKHAESVKLGKKEHYERVRHLPEFKVKRDAYAAATKERKREYDKAYRARNEEKLKVVKEAWRSKNRDVIRMIQFTYDAKRRAQVKAGDSSRKVREWLKTQKKVCHWCRAKCEKDYHLDHIQPLARGGEHVTTNLCVACPSCNIRKNARDPIEFAQSLGLLL